MRRPRSEWNYEQDIPGVTIGHGEGGRPEGSDPMAVLWVPDIDARHKWREYAIDKPGVPRRVAGFRKPGER